MCVRVCEPMQLSMRLSKSLNLSLDTTKLATMATMSGTNPPLLLMVLGLVLGEMAELDNKIKQTSPGKQATVVKSIFVCLILRKEVTNDNEDDASDDAANEDDGDRRSVECYHTTTISYGVVYCLYVFRQTVNDFMVKRHKIEFCVVAFP